MTARRDLRLHQTCHHKEHALSCAEFEQLIKRSAGKCEICLKAPETPVRYLQIDHDHTYGAIGAGGVRGLLCQKCNVHLGLVDRGGHELTDADRRYLDNAWHQGES